MKKTLALLAVVPLLALGCSSEEKPTVPEATPADTAAAVHDAKCGCVIEDIGTCGNYVEIDGKYVVLEHPLLGTMEFCADKENGAKIKIAGAMTDGKYVATTYERVD